MNYGEFDKLNEATLVSYGTTFIMDLWYVEQSYVNPPNVISSEIMNITYS